MLNQPTPPVSNYKSVFCAIEMLKSITTPCYNNVLCMYCVWIERAISYYNVNITARIWWRVSYILAVEVFSSLHFGSFVRWPGKGRYGVTATVCVVITFNYQNGVIPPLAAAGGPGTNKSRGGGGEKRYWMFNAAKNIFDRRNLSRVYLISIFN